MNKQEINKNSPRALLELMTAYTPLVVDCIRFSDRSTVVGILKHHGFVPVDMPEGVAENDTFNAGRVFAYITNSGQKQYTFRRYGFDVGLNFAIHVNPEWLLKSNPLPTDKVQEIDHEANDLCEATHTHCDYTPAIQATANKLINHGYTDIGEGDCEHTNLYMNHEEKTFYTK